MPTVSFVISAPSDSRQRAVASKSSDQLSISRRLSLSARAAEINARCPSDFEEMIRTRPLRAFFPILISMQILLLCMPQNTGYAVLSK